MTMAVFTISPMICLKKLISQEGTVLRLWRPGAGCKQCWIGKKLNERKYESLFISDDVPEYRLDVRGCQSTAEHYLHSSRRSWYWRCRLLRCGQLQDAAY